MSESQTFDTDGGLCAQVMHAGRVCLSKRDDAVHEMEYGYCFGAHHFVPGGKQQTTEATEGEPKIYFVGPSTYRTKIVEIQAIRLDELNLTEVIQWVNENGGDANEHHNRHEGVHLMQIDTDEGVMSANRGDFIIRGLRGEFYPCKPDVFEAKYERVE